MEKYLRIFKKNLMKQDIIYNLLILIPLILGFLKIEKE